MRTRQNVLQKCPCSAVEICLVVLTLPYEQARTRTHTGWLCLCHTDVEHPVFWQEECWQESLACPNQSPPHTPLTRSLTHTCVCAIKKRTPISEEHHQKVNYSAGGHSAPSLTSHFLLSLFPSVHPSVHRPSSLTRLSQCLQRSQSIWPAGPETPKIWPAAGPQEGEGRRTSARSTPSSTNSGTPALLQQHPYQYETSF